MADKEFPLSLIIRAVDRATAPLRKINERMRTMTAPVRKLNNSIKALSTEAGFPRVAAGVRSVGTALGNVGAAAATAGKRIAFVLTSAGGLAWAFNRQFIQTADTFERLEISLRAIEGSAAGASRAMAFIERLTVETPFELEDVAKAFRIMRGFGLDPMDGSLQAIIDQTAKLGLTGEDLAGVALQLGQAFSKGRLQAQDANILVERGVPVWGLLQRAVERLNPGMQITVGELRKMSEAGELGTRAIRVLIEQMGLESKGAAKEFMGSWTGMVSNLVDLWTFFKRDVMASGPLQHLKARLHGILDEIERMRATGEFARLAETVGKRLVAAFQALESMLPDVWEALKDIGAAIAWVARAMGGWGNLIKFGLATYIAGPLLVSLAGLAASLTTLGQAIFPLVARGAALLWPMLLRLGAVVLPLLGKALLAVGAAFVKVGIAMLTTPVGWVLLAIAAIAAAAYLIYENWEPIKEFFAELWDSITGFFADAWKKIRPIIDKIISAVDVLPIAWFTKGAMKIADFFHGEEEEAPSLGAAAAAQSSTSEAHVTVDFNNLPKGARVSANPHNSTPLDLNLGYSMVGP